MANIVLGNDNLNYSQLILKVNLPQMHELKLSCLQMIFGTCEYLLNNEINKFSANYNDSKKNLKF